MKNKNGEGRLSEWISSLRWTLYELFRKIGAPHGNKPKKLKNKKKKGALFCTAMLALPLLQFFLFYICVNFTSVLLAFQKLDVNGNAVWVGLENFKTLFRQFQTEKVFTYALKNSLLSYLIGTICTTPLTLIFSFYIYKKMFGHNLMKIMLFLPSVISSIVMVMIYTYFVDLAVPVFFESVFHIEIQGLYSNAEIRFRTILFYNIWFGLGGGILMYLSAMNSINESVVEAAQLEGAGYWQEFVHITLPMIYPTFTTFFIVGIAGIFTNQMNLYTFGGSLVNLRDYTLGYYLFKQALDGQINYPRLSALGLLMTAILVPLTFLVRYCLEKFGPSTEE